MNQLDHPVDPQEVLTLAQWERACAIVGQATAKDPLPQLRAWLDGDPQIQAILAERCIDPLYFARHIHMILDAILQKRRERIAASAWGQNCQKESPSCWEEALRLASRDRVEVEIYLSDETGEPLYAIHAKGSKGFWLDAKPTLAEAKDLCATMGWIITEEPNL